MADDQDIFQSPLALRNAGPEMLKLFSPRHKFGLWRRLWLELARCQRELGLGRISAEALEQMEKALDEIDLAKARDWEHRLRHDVMAHIRTFEEAAPAAKGIIHLGATSMYVVDNADLLILRDALTWVAQWLANAVDALGSFGQTLEGFADARRTRIFSRPSSPRSASARPCGRRISPSTLDGSRASPRSPCVSAASKARPARKRPSSPSLTATQKRWPHSMP
jgi:hypothetical protein